MQVLLLGVGMQGKVALYDLVKCDDVTAITAADYDVKGLEAFVAAHQLSGKVRCEFRDDGPGYPQDVLQFEHHKVGFDMIQSIVRKSLRGELSLHNDGGAVAAIRFKAKV